MRNLQGLFSPKAVAVIGASSREGTVGHSVFHNLLFNNYTGVIYPINPKYKSLLGVRCYESVKVVDDVVDLAVIIVPSRAALDVLRECGEAGVKNVIIISAGFKEVGGEGVKLEEEVRNLVRELGISLMGPNCLGLITTDPEVSMNASFSRTMPKRGNIGFLSQSGALCTAILDYAKGSNVGFSKFISFGNKADLTENDLLAYLADDPLTDVILIYVEDLTDGRRFIEIAREITGERKPPKPILVVKAGRTPEGAGAAASHTGSLAGTDEVYDAILAQSGVLRVETVEDLFNYAMVFADQPLPKGNRVAIVTNAGGPGIMTTDACMRYGLKLAQFQPSTTEGLKAKLPPTANIHNPIDVIGDAQHDRYEAALQLAVQDEGVDSVIVVLTPQDMTDIEAIAEVVCNISKDSPKPIIASFMGLRDVSQGVNILREHRIPHYAFPEEAPRTLAAAYKYTQWIYRPRTEEKHFEVDKAKAERIIEHAIQEGRRNLPEVEALQILEAYGFPMLPYTVAKDQKEVVEACDKFGYPIVLKIASPDILHKTDIGGVKVGLRSREEAIKGFEEIMQSVQKHFPEANIWGINVQKMAPVARSAKEIILGSKRDRKFGPLLMFGLGGIYAEAFQDVSFRLAPIRELSAGRMIRSIRAYRILEGFRGEKPADVAAIAECLQRLSQLVLDFPKIDELDINPLFVYPEGQGVVVIDSRIILS